MQRNQSLDVLRGFAILAMVLSSSIAFGILPAWMYHAQVPPPDHIYNPELPGITWVDLVFPFFLFSMGAALPLALHKRVEVGEPEWKLTVQIAKRYILLVFFAIFTLHARAWVMSAKPGMTEQLLSIACFVLLFFMYVDWKGEGNRKLLTAVKVLAFLLAGAFLFCMPFSDGKGWQLQRSDIIIIVLANMAFFGSLIWLPTRHKPQLRIGILPFVMAVFLTGKLEGTWNSALFTWTPFSWMYQFYYLKYLFIIIPGTFAGEWLLALMQEGTAKPSGKHPWTLIGLASIVLIGLNTALLFARFTVLNLLFTGAIITVLFYLMRHKGEDAVYRCRKKFIQAGAYLLLLGLFFDAYEGGVKKDPSTYSYYFITSGLAFFAMLAFDTLERVKLVSPITNFLAMVGKNPMVAYVTGNLLLLPLLRFSGAMVFFQMMEANVWLGVLRGVLFTGIVSLVTILFVKKKWYWKT
jgi:predicted acyltransferase